MARKLGTENKVFHRWTEEELNYLKHITPGHHHKEIHELVNKKFGLNLTLDQIKGTIKRHNLKTGFTGQFKKGNKPHNKGLKGICAKGCEKTWFKKGITPINHRPIGSERVSVDGYTEVKVSEPNKWRLKHQLVYESSKGKIPKGYAVIFGDGDKSNFDIDNLILVSRHQLLTLNRNNLIQDDTELTKTGVIIADTIIKINEVRKKDR